MFGYDIGSSGSQEVPQDERGNDGVVERAQYGNELGDEIDR